MLKVEFEIALASVLRDLPDPGKLNHNPLAQVMPSGFINSGESKGQTLQHEIEESILKLKLDESGPGFSAVKRRLEILRLRYIENFSVKELENQVNLGERQIRRESQKAIALLTDFLWSHWGLDQLERQQEKRSEDILFFKPNISPNNLIEIFMGVLDLLQELLLPQQPKILFEWPEKELFIICDRALIRQALLITLKNIYNSEMVSPVHIHTEIHEDEILLIIQVHHGALDKEKPEIKKIYDLLEMQMVKVFKKIRDETLEIVIVFPKSAPKLLMVIDDDEASFQLYRRFLAEKPWRLNLLKNVDQVQQNIVDLKPDLILLDVLIPKIDGWDILKIIKSCPIMKETPVIISSAWYDRNTALSLGADDFLGKPVTQESLLSILDKWFNH
jgi:CheY-like chemotaxis protein